MPNFREQNVVSGAAVLISATTIGNLELLDGEDNPQSLQSQSSYSESESQHNSHVKPKSIEKVFRCWKFSDTIQADALEGSFQDRKQQLIEHIRTQTTPDRPFCVLSVTIFADLKDLLFFQPNEAYTISIPIVGYAQTRSSPKFAMRTWIKSANWEPVSGGLCSNHEFLQFMDYANNPSKSWFNLPIFDRWYVLSMSVRSIRVRTHTHACAPRCGVCIACFVSHCQPHGPH